MKIEKHEPKIYILAGTAHVGKDTTADIIKKIYEENNKKCITIQYSFYIKEYAKKIGNWDGSEETKPRTLLQVIGTEVIREKIDSLFFINRVLQDIEVYSYFYDAIIISDARLEEEITIPKSKYANVTAIKIVRENFDSGLTAQEKKHYTEVALDNFKDYNYILDNNGTIDELKDKVKKMLEEVK